MAYSFSPSASGHWIHAVSRALHRQTKAMGRSKHWAEDGANLYEIPIESAKPAITLLSFCGLTSYLFVRGGFEINRKFCKWSIALWLFWASGHLGFFRHDKRPCHLTPGCGQRLHAGKTGCGEHISFDVCLEPSRSPFQCFSHSKVSHSSSSCRPIMRCLDWLMLHSVNYVNLQCVLSRMTVLHCYSTTAVHSTEVNSQKSYEIF